MLVLLNPRASYGRAADIWRRVAPALEERSPGFRVEEIGPGSDVAAAVGRGRENGERTFVAAGGDGTVNAVLNAIVGIDEGGAAGVTLGAIGMGSSNDFHKPFRPEALLAGVPVRIDAGRARTTDVIRIDYEDPGGVPATRHALMNASLGVTAEANARFNDPTAFIRTARTVSVDGAIVAAVLTTVATFRDIVCRLSVDAGEAETIPVTNLGVIKSPHFGGSFCYDTPIEPDDGALGVNLCERLTRFQVLTTLAALRKRRFRGRPKTRSWICQSARVEADRVFALETDGEIVRARAAEFTVLPGKVRVAA